MSSEGVLLEKTPGARLIVPLKLIIVEPILDPIRDAAVVPCEGIGKVLTVTGLSAVK